MIAKLVQLNHHSIAVTGTDYDTRPQEVVRRDGWRCPASPTHFTDTRLSGRMVNIVSEACFREILSHASGGNWRARQTKYLKVQSKKGFQSTLIKMTKPV